MDELGPQMPGIVRKSQKLFVMKDRIEMSARIYLDFTTELSVLLFNFFSISLFGIWHSFFFSSSSSFYGHAHGKWKFPG